MNTMLTAEEVHSQLVQVRWSVLSQCEQSMCVQCRHGSDGIWCVSEWLQGACKVGVALECVTDMDVCATMLGSSWLWERCFL